MAEIDKLPKHLLNSNICVYILRGQKGMCEQLKKIGWHNCCASEMTIAKLLYGAECSNSVSESIGEVLSFCADTEIIPVGIALSERASQKAKLGRKGTSVDDIDLFIGVTTVVIDAIMVTENVKHLNRMESIRTENWVSEEQFL